jgi:serine kinase of HPr protein (carbohydrate metabolism regulator)
MIAGVSGAGKSTLSVALAEEGFNYVSDDWTYISQSRDGIMAHGTSAPVKLLPNAVEHFKNLRRHSLQTSMNGELAYEVDIAEAFGARVQRACEPRCLMFLERTQRAGAAFRPMSSTESRRYLNSSVERLPLQLHEAAAMRERTIESVALLPSWHFRYGGTPQFAARQLREFVVHRRQEIYA